MCFLKKIICTDITSSNISFKYIFLCEGVRTQTFRNEKILTIFVIVYSIVFKYIKNICDISTNINIDKL